MPAYTAGILTDGFGYGGFGLGGFGSASASYSWTSEPLGSGAWHWAVLPFDAAGNQGTAVTVEVLVQVPPLPPGPFSDRTRFITRIRSRPRRSRSFGIRARGEPASFPSVPVFSVQ